MESGVLDPKNRNGLKDPLLSKEPDEPPVTGYASAGLFSRLFFLWLSPLLNLGSARDLQEDDVPTLSPSDKAQELYDRLNARWDKQKQEPNSFRNSLIRTFWWPCFQCGLLLFVRVCVAYVGPAMISSFMTVTSGQERYPYERFVLVGVLVAAKVVEATATHMYNFQGKRLGMQVRSATISVVFRKGLKLSSSAREKHGSGQIVNLVSIDAQCLADTFLYLHSSWSVPLQTFLAGFIIYPLLGGFATLVGFAVLVSAGTLVSFNMLWCQRIQGRWSKARDSRVQALEEALINMKIIKLQAWDDKFYKIVEQARAEEYGHLWKFTFGVCGVMLIAWITPVVCCIVAFTCAVYSGVDISISAAFTTITIVRTFQELFRLFPNFLFSMVQCAVSLERLEKYLWSDELETDAVVRLSNGSSDIAVCVGNGSFKWDVDAEAPILQDICLEIKQRSLVAVVGKVGAGKSSLLAALQGEIPKISGTITTCGTTACVSQTAWIQNATIQENILFGRPLQKERYQRVLNRCALLPDLAQMDYGDLTEIGERGVNLSGGQKQRIQLARALYQECDIYFLDDIFSAVDAHTGSHLFKECVIGALADKTVVLVTHQIEFLPKADLILVLRDGKIVQSGKYEELLQEGMEFEALVAAHRQSLEKVEAREEKDEEQIQDDQDLAKLQNGSRRLSTSGSSHSQDLGNEGPKGTGPGGEGGRLVDDEQKEKGKVGFSVYWAYITRIYRGAMVFGMLILLILGQGCQIASDYWVAADADYEQGNKSEALHFIAVYGGLSGLNAILGALRPVLASVIALLTAQSFFFGMWKSIFRAPMSFFDTTPNSRTLSRATTDQGAIDFYIPQVFGTALATLVVVSGSVVVTATTVPWILVALLPLALYLRYAQERYLKSSRELTRMDGITKAPIIHHFSETIAGISTIRCFKQQDRFISTSLERIEANFKMDFHSNATVEWCGLRMELGGCIFIGIMGLLLILAPELQVLGTSVIRPEQVGLALTYSLNLNVSVYALAWLWCFLENKMISVERLQQFSNLPTEAELTKEETKPPPDWPVMGSIKLEDFKLRYRNNTPLVLKGLTVNIEGGEKVGIVGRTGSGKSTFLLGLFRLVESAGGRILIDGTDISTLGLHDLRSRLSIIPQDPTLFTGTVRDNLDPLGHHSDVEIWEALEKCQLSAVVSRLEGKLATPVTSNGSNWSVGQRQLFCLGRVLLRKTKILVLDEATSSVDTETDAVMQKILRQDFRSCTVISIAHRIPSVMDSDKVLVLDAGLVKEFDSPTTLLGNPSSLFSALVAEYAARAET